jgi:hypothetical protein
MNSWLTEKGFRDVAIDFCTGARQRVMFLLWCRALTVIGTRTQAIIAMAHFTIRVLVVNLNHRRSASP